MILVIDNYDSFVYNLARYFEVLGFECNVVRNNALSVTEVKKLNPDAIVISPGPCDPSQAGISLSLVHELGKHIPVLGVCLGHQVIGKAFGAVVGCAKEPMHGKSSMIAHNSEGLFAGIENPMQVGRYHSLIVEQKNFPNCLEIDSFSDKGEVMALHHKEYPIYGVQFHPESVLTKQGDVLLHNFLQIIN